MKTQSILFTTLFIFMLGRSGFTQDHAHAAPHGGQVITVGSYHYEMLVKPGEIQLYVLDEHLKTLPIKDMQGTLLVQFPDKTKKNVNLEPAGEYFRAVVETGPAKSFIAIASVAIAGKTQTGRFSHSDKKTLNLPEEP